MRENHFFCGSASLIQRLAYDRSQILSVSVLLSGDYNLKETVFKGFVFILLFRVLFLASCCVCNGTFLSFFFSLPDNACNYFDHQGTGPCNEVFKSRDIMAVKKLKLAFDEACPSIHPFSADLKAGKVAADGSPGSDC